MMSVLYDTIHIINTNQYIFLFLKMYSTIQKIIFSIYDMMCDSNTIIKLIDADYEAISIRNKLFVDKLRTLCIGVQ